jgi:hypothetical protein
MRSALPGFHCTWSVPAGAVELAEAYTAHGLSREGFERRFTRLARLIDRTAQGSLDSSLRPVPVG